MEDAAEKIFIDLRDHISTYAGLKFRLLKLIAIERTARFMSVLSHGIALMSLVFFTILFLFIALGFYLGEVLGSVALGFLIVGGICFLVTLCFVWSGDRIRLKLMNLFIDAMRAKDDDDDTQDKSTESPRTDVAREERNPEAMPGIGNGD